MVNHINSVKMDTEPNMEMMSSAQIRECTHIGGLRTETAAKDLILSKFEEVEATRATYLWADIKLVWPTVVMHNGWCKRDEVGHGSIARCKSYLFKRCQTILSTHCNKWICIEQ